MVVCVCVRLFAGVCAGVCVVSQRSSLDSAPRRRSGEAARELGKKSVFDSDFQRAVLENSPTSGQDSGREDAGSHCTLERSGRRRRYSVVAVSNHHKGTIAHQ